MSKPRYFCPVCENTTHNARTLSTGALECPARVIRLLPAPGSVAYDAGMVATRVHA